MSHDYLWDGSGPPDPDVERLEQRLRPLRSTAPPPVLASIDSMPRRDGSRLPRWSPHARRRIGLPLLAAAALLVVFILPRIATRSVPARPATGWSVTPLDGRASLAGARVDREVGLQAGQTVTTDAGARVRMARKGIGEIVLGPLSALRLVTAGDGLHRVALERGSLRAVIVSPPGQFVVDTPSARAVDLGCVYTLRLDERGDGVLSVQAGWVGFEFQGRESFVPAGAWCPTTRARGPGLPRFEDAAPAFLDALDSLEQAATPEATRSALPLVLATARERDAFTLWHLLQVVAAPDREQVYDTLARLAAPPEGVTREHALRLDRAALDRWWDALGLGDVGLWRAWKRRLLE